MKARNAAEMLIQIRKILPATQPMCSVGRSTKKTDKLSRAILKIVFKTTERLPRVYYLQILIMRICCRKVKWTQSVDSRDYLNAITERD